MNAHDQPEPTVFVIFGGTGDLVSRKLIPALFDLFLDHSMPDMFSIIAVGRAEMKTEELVQQFHDGVVQFSSPGRENSEAWQQFARHIIYHQGIFTDPRTMRLWPCNAPNWTRNGRSRHSAYSIWPHRRPCSAKSPRASPDAGAGSVGGFPAQCFPNYAAGTWDPEDSHSLLARHGHSWPLAKELVKRSNVMPKCP